MNEMSPGHWQFMMAVDCFSCVFYCFGDLRVTDYLYILVRPFVDTVINLATNLRNCYWYQLRESVSTSNFRKA